MLRPLALLCSLSLCACATQSASRLEAGAADEDWESYPLPAPTVPPAMEDPLGPRIAAAASSLVGLRGLSRVSREVPDDCTGLVRVAFYAAGIDLMAHGNLRGENGVSAIWRMAEAARATHFKGPLPGDLVFFIETYDRNRDGVRNDGRTHIGVVESVEPDGTVVFVHRSGRGVGRSKLHPSRPGRPHNDVLRPASSVARAYDAGELFAGYASPQALLALVHTAPRAIVVRDEPPPQRAQARKSKTRR